MPSCAALASSAFSRCFIEVKRCHTQRTPAGKIDSPRRFSASETRTWPQAGCSIAISTTACSISGAVPFFRIGFLRLISCKASSQWRERTLWVHSSAPAIGRCARMRAGSSGQ
jgi:hypothetical protein